MCEQLFHLPLTAHYICFDQNFYLSVELPLTTPGYPGVSIGSPQSWNFILSGFRLIVDTGLLAIGATMRKAIDMDRQISDNAKITFLFIHTTSFQIRRKHVVLLQK
jgi:hypothetical protein